MEGSQAEIGTDIESAMFSFHDVQYITGRAIYMISKRAAETRTIARSFADRLVHDELLTGTPTVVEVGSSDLTISSPALTVADGYFFNAWLIESKAVTFSVAGGTAGHSYLIRVSVATDSDAPQTLTEEITLRVN